VTLPEAAMVSSGTHEWPTFFCVFFWLAVDQASPFFVAHTREMLLGNSLAGAFIAFAVAE
jgi:hypothetical protein